jgi:uncharacterized cupredoxin-like copper-binding protein
VTVEARAPAWTDLLRRATAVGAVVVVVSAVVLRDKEAGVVATGLVAGFFLVRSRYGLVGRLVLTVVYAATEFFMLPAAVSNVQHGASLLFVVLPLALAVIAATGLVALAGTLAAPHLAGAPRFVGQAAVTVFVVGVIVASLPGVGSGDRARPGDVLLSTRNTAYSKDTLRARSRSGLIGLRMTNHDLFWHTFTVDALHVDVRVPVGGRRRIGFRAPPGRYRFYCRVPGHTRAGMHGTLVVVG